MDETLEIRVLGGLEVRSAGAALELPRSKKTRALLGYLAVSARPHTREHLCDLLWQGPDNPRAALRWSLAKLRSLLGSEGLVTEHDTVGLASVATDLGRVRAALETANPRVDPEQLREAARRFRGELLEGLALPDCHRFHQWCLAEREAARALRRSVLGALADEPGASPEDALVWAREQVTLDPTSEAAHARVVHLLARLGRRREALAQYETCVRVLARELGTRPSAVLLEAKMEIGQPADEPASQPPMAPPPAPRAVNWPPVVGRSAELGRINRALDSSASGAVQPVIVFSGEPGIGKSRLLDELARGAAQRGGIALAGRAFEAEMVRPYGPFIDALRMLPETHFPSTLAGRLTGLLPEFGGAGAADRNSLFDAVVQVLSRVSEVVHPVVLLLDDLQWFDETSAALLHYVARANLSGKVLIACGMRPAEVRENRAAQGALRGLAEARRCELMELSAMDPSAISSLTHSVAPGVDPERIFRDSGGNPLLALELVRALERGEVGVSESVERLITERLGRLSEAAREIVVWAAALGKNFDLELLRRVTGAQPLDLLERVGELERHAVVRAAADGSKYDFVHDLVRRGAYSGLSDPRRRVVHGSIARVLAADPDPHDVLAAEVAHHAALGGEPGLSVRAALSAARRCLRVFARADAIRLSRGGLEHVGALPTKERIAHQLALLQVLVYAGDADAHRQEFAVLLADAVDQAERAGMAEQAAEGLRALSVLQFDKGDSGAARDATLRAAEQTRDADPLAHALQLGHTARCLAMIDREMDRAYALFCEAEDLARRADAQVVSVEWARGMFCWFRGEHGDALASLRRALALVRLAEDRWAEYECQRCIVSVELESRDFEGAQVDARELDQVAAKMVGGSERSVSRALLALRDLAVGEPGAEVEFERALSQLRLEDAQRVLGYVLTLAAEYDLDAGRLDVAERRATDALAAAEVVDHASLVVLARSTLARIACARGDAASARHWLASGVPDAPGPFALSARAREHLMHTRALLGAG